MDPYIISLMAMLMFVKDSLVDKPLAININIAAGKLTYNDSRLAILENINMCLPAGQWSCILGRSGCGKTSLLRFIAGLLNNQASWSGELQINGKQGDLKQQIAYMAQQDLLMPWLSLLDNVLLSANFGKNKPVLDKNKALMLLEKVGLAEYAQQLPQQLSGGMRQRVALARTLMQDKPVVLMDEPFSALDAVTRYQLQELAWLLLKDKTVVLITHDPQEAIRLADHIYILQGQPSTAHYLKVPDTLPPRQFDAECAQLQQDILKSLGQKHA
jgi:putative hydroxymethylpyrimidine transport system ATP-binding protein